MIKIDERQLLIRDAQLLIRQYENRNERTNSLTLEQRKIWAAEMVYVLGAMYKIVDDAIGTDALHFNSTVAWNEAMTAGTRKVTFKVPLGPAYGGKKLKEPEFKDDPTDSRGKDPRHLR